MNYYELRYEDIVWGWIKRKFNTLADAQDYAPECEYEIWHYNRGIGTRLSVSKPC